MAGQQHQAKACDGGHNAAGAVAETVLARLAGPEDGGDACHTKDGASIGEDHHGFCGGVAVHQSGEEDGGQQDAAEHQGEGADLGRQGGDAGLGLEGIRLGQRQEGQTGQQHDQRNEQQHKAGQGHQLKEFLQLPDLVVGGQQVQVLVVAGKGSLVEVDGVARGGLGEVVPGVGLFGLVDDPLAAVRGLVPDAGFGVLLLQEGLACGGGHPVLADDGALVGVIVGQEEEFVVLGADLADGAAAAGGSSHFGGQAQSAGVHVVGALGQAAVDHPDAAGLIGGLVQIEGHGGGETAHGMAGDADDAVALLVLQDVGLLVHVVHRVIQGGGPEIEEPAGVFRIGLGVAVVIHIQGQHHIAAAGQFDGVGVLHLAGVQVAVGDHNGGAGILCGSPFGHVQQAAEGALFGVKADSLHRDGVAGGVEHLGKDAADQNKDERYGDQQQWQLLFV